MAYQLEDPALYRAKAAELRKAASETASVSARAIFCKLADSYDRLALSIEKVPPPY